VAFATAKRVTFGISRHTQKYVTWRHVSGTWYSSSYAFTPMVISAATSNPNLSQQADTRMHQVVSMDETSYPETCHAVMPTPNVM
jgi:hypothetical protein